MPTGTPGLNHICNTQLTCMIPELLGAFASSLQDMALVALAAVLLLQHSSLLSDSANHTWRRFGGLKGIRLQWWTDRLTRAEFMMTFLCMVRMASASFGLPPNLKNASKPHRPALCLRSFGNCCLGLIGHLSQFFEQVQRLGCNLQSWCDGQGCVLPKPGGVPGPDGQRIINLLDPAGKLFHKALLGFGADSPADHQYGYVAHRSRRDAILLVEAWLDRLRANKISTATTLFDLTKASLSIDY